MFLKDFQKFLIIKCMKALIIYTFEVLKFRDMNLIELTDGSIYIDELTRCHKCFHKRRQIHWESVRPTVKTVFVASFFIK